MTMVSLFLLLLLCCSVIASAAAFTTQESVYCPRRAGSSTQLAGWLDNFLPKPMGSTGVDRQRDFPEQYPATYELLNDSTINDKDATAKLVRPLLKKTMLEARELQVIYDANRHGWTPQAFHKRVDGRGGAVVIATTVKGTTVGGYNPKGWSSNGGARPSVAAFLFYTDSNDKASSFQKLRKVGGGGLACARDDPNYGIAFGPDGLVIALSDNYGPKQANSKLGPYFERGPDDLSSLFPNGGSVQLKSLQVLVGIYGKDEEIPYNGAVMDMTSG
jgi:hypothetical protein